jgi:MYXO-CTERM domain-containing protein
MVALPYPALQSTRRRRPRTLLGVVIVSACSLGLLGSSARAEPPTISADAPRAPWPQQPQSRAEATGWVPGDPRPTSPGPRPGETALAGSPGLRRLRPKLAFLPGAGQQQGALTGKTIYLSPGHGWTYKASASWYSQRGKTHGVVEDMSNADGIRQFLLPYLWAAGAQVMPVRELDQQTEMQILDNADGTTSPSRGSYSESGDAALFTTSSQGGWGHPTLPLTSTENPFSLGKNRLIKTSPNETARATFALNVPRSGYYLVYVAYSMFSARPSDARYVVVHPGGKTTYLIDQRRHGATWVLLGRHWFDAGTDAQKGAVIVSNQSGDAGSYVSVDAVRIGGGIGLMDRGGGVSGQPRADENSRYNAQFCGAPASVYNNSSGDDGTDDVSTRSLMADWLHAEGEDSVYISHHSNAFNGAARGTVTYIYGSNPPNGSYTPDSRVIALGADKLANAIQNELITDIRAEFDPSWQDRKVKTAYFGEINPNRQDEMPAALLELAFHDNDKDAAMLKDPHFRRVTARAIYKGIVKYFAAKDGSPVHLIPEPPQAVQVRNSGAGAVTVSWKPPPSGGILGDPPAGYRVYTSRHGFAFDEGIDAGDTTELTLKNLTAGEVLFVRVVALNEGGESLPSPTLAVGVAEAGRAATLLLVGGYDRFDSGLNLLRDYSKFTQVNRLHLEQMNDGTLLSHYGRALRGQQLAFDSAWHDAVTASSGGVPLNRYRAVLWAAGKGLGPDRALSDDAIAMLAGAAQVGVSVLLSGSNVARQLASSSAAQAKVLLEQQLSATLASEDQLRGEVVPAAMPGVFSAMGAMPLGSDPWRPFPVGSVDTVEAAAAGKLTASYGAGGGALVETKSAERCALLATFPLAALASEDRRAQAIQRVATHCPLDGGAVPPGDGGGGKADAGPGPDADGGGGSGDWQAGGDGATGGDDGGCGCRVRGASASPSVYEALAVLGLLALLVVRRRRRRR